MAFDPILATNIEAGDPVSQELWEKVRLNFDDLDSRLSTAELAVNKFLPIQFSFFGAHWKAATAGMAFYRIPFNMTLTGARLYIPIAGSAGSTTVDVQRSAAGGGAFASIFSVLPTLAFGAGDHATALGTLSFVGLTGGDLLRLDLSAIQTAACESFLYLSFEAA